MTDQHTEDITREIEQYAAERAKQDQIVETRPGRAGETYIPNTPWRRQDNSPHPVPELDSSGQPWRITGRGLHVGSHNGEDYCLEWLPTELLPVEPAMPPEKPAPVPRPVAEVEEDMRRRRDAGRQRDEETVRRTGPRLGADVDQPEFGPNVGHDDQGLEAL
jgi:hypothetical protein